MARRGNELVELGPMVLNEVTGLPDLPGNIVWSVEKDYNDAKRVKVSFREVITTEPKWLDKLFGAKATVDHYHTDQFQYLWETCGATKKEVREAAASLYEDARAEYQLVYATDSLIGYYPPKSAL